MDSQKSMPFEIWKMGGVTEHMGGVNATRRLLDPCAISSRHLVLDLGCGTGFTAALLAKEYKVRVTALDLTKESIRGAAARITREGLENSVYLLQADAHSFPFPSSIFDRVLVESVLVFCDSGRVLSEIYRVLKPDGIFGANELTLLRPAPESLYELLKDTLGISGLQEADWRAAFEKVGFHEVSSKVYRIRLREQLSGHLQVDGIGKYLGAIVLGVKNPAIRKTFFNRKVLSAARQFMPYVGYGLYYGIKPT